MGLRRILRWLWMNKGAPKLDEEVSRRPSIRPRNVTATRGEVDTLLSAACPCVRLWLLLCAHLAIRSGTAAHIGPANYNAERQELRFRTKKEAIATLPVTRSIADLITKCDLDDSRSFVEQLRAREHKLTHEKTARRTLEVWLNTQMRELRDRCGITRRVTPHDLRRTTAVALYEHTRDIRDVQALLTHRNMQSTIWYLDHDLKPISRDTLEVINGGRLDKEKSA